MARIMIVEDEPLISMMLADWLEELGHETLGPAETVSEALQLIEETTPSAVILDVNLRNERCDAVAEILNARSIPMVVATGSHAAEVPPNCSNALVIIKPYDFETVQQVIASLTAR